MRLRGDGLAPTDYMEATLQEVEWRQKADAAAERRADALARMHQSGMSYGQIAEATGLSRSRVQQLVERSNRLLRGSAVADGYQD